jgi:hypothetical protein
MSDYHKTLTYDQVRYNPATDRCDTFEQGLDRQLRVNWYLVTSFTSQEYTAGSVQMFVFRRGK